MYKKLFLGAVITLIAQSSFSQSYVRTWEAKVPVSNASTLSTRPVSEVLQTTGYVDGLGRPLQTVIKQGSLYSKFGTQGDVVSPVVYDPLGREVQKYLPYVSSATDGALKSSPLVEQNSFFSTQLSGQGETYFYSNTDVENSPLNRPVKTYPAGNSWVGSARGTTVHYYNNEASDHVKIWKVNGANSYEITGEYAAGLLTEMHTADEAGNEVVEYKDKEGKVILKKVQAGISPNNDYYDWLSTYYIYDDYGNLRLVLQPKAVAQLVADSWPSTLTTSNYNDLLNELAFRYEYDGKNRMSIKKVPGAAEVYMIYDKWDRLVLTQDGNMRINDRWIFTKFDYLNRPVMTGFYTDATYTGQSGMQTYVDGLMSSLARFETLSPLSPPGYTTGATFPSLFSADPLTVTFYDNYDWASAYNPTYAAKDNTDDGEFYTPGNTSNYAQGLTQSSMTKGLVTGGVAAVLNGQGSQQGMLLVSSVFYDDHGRAIQSKASNITGGIDITTSQYNFSGQPLMSVQQQQVTGTNAQTIKLATKIEYDALNRLKQIKKSITQKANGNTYPAAPVERTVVSNEYDKLGQLTRKVLAPEYNSNAGLEKLDYEYNVRGWMNGFNKDYLSGSTPHYFGMELAYDKTTSAASGTSYAASQYNGNITGTVWKSKGDGVERQYNFTYDKLNRLLKGDFKQHNSNNTWNNSEVNFNMKMGSDGSDNGTAYDENGNIKKMQQWGLVLNTSQQIDNLSYVYANSGLSNKLINVSDAATAYKLGDFTDGTNFSNDYSYDVNGNMVTDLNKELADLSGFFPAPGITYNHLNLPEFINATGSQAYARNINYVYDAAGNKLQKIVHEEHGKGVPSTNRITTYIGGMVYETYSNGDPNDPANHTDELQFAGHEEGRIRFKPAVGTTPQDFAYDYFIKDHLGNVRMVLTEEVRTDAYPVASMETAQAATEETFYANLPATRQAKSGITGYPTDTYTSPNDYVAQVNGSGNKIGPSITLKVMAGDKFSLRVTSWYKTNGTTPGTPVNPLTDLIAALAGGIVNTNTLHGVTTATDIVNSGVLSPGMTNFLNNQSTVSGRPRSYVNWILFDEQFKLVSSSSGFEQVGSDEEFKEHVKNNMPIDKNGYLYIYISNTTPNINVFFDNLQVTHVRGQILEETHYYPFGLTMAGISSKAAGSMENKKKYNGIEFNSDFDIDSYDAFYRNLDPQIGRWWQIDPKTERMEQWSTYASNYNNPIKFLDQLGDEPDGDGPGPEPMPGLFQRAVNFMVGVYSEMGHRAEVNFAKDVSWVKKTTNTLASNAKENWNSGNTMVQQMGRDFMSEPMSFINGKGEVNMVKNILGVEVKEASILQKNMAKFESKSLTEQAGDLVKANGGKNSVTLGTATQQIRYDLAGRAHGNVPTPHKQVYNKNFTHGQLRSISRASKEAIPLTQQEVRMIRKYLEKINKPK